MPKPIPSFKKPTSTIPTEAMAAFVSGRDATLEPERPTEGAALFAVGPVAPEAVPEAPSVVAEAPRSLRAKRSSPAKSSGRRLEPRTTGESVRKVTVYLDPDLDRRLSIHAVTNGLDRSGIVAEALLRLLGKG